MSKKSASQTKVFISFGDVAGGLKSGGSGSTAMSSLSTPLPLYTGSDSELVMLSKKLMKKDGVTKLKAIQDLVVVLPTRPEHILSDFLVFFVYGFTKLWVEDHRAIREKLCAIITTIVTVEKRLLAPHMKTLIGPWWMLTGDPIGDVSHAAFSAFCSAIPPKKRQQVLVYLSGPILSEAIKNINLRSDALCDLAVTPIEEAEERLERVIVSSLASVEKFITMLTTEQNQQLASVNSGSSSPSDPSASYRDLFTASVWTKCLESKFVLVRRAAYQLMATAASHVPEVFLDQGSSQSVSSLFFQQVVNCLLVETSVLNLNVLLSSFISLLTAVPAFFSVATVSGDIIPALSHLLKTNPQLALEFVLPIVGCFPTALVALLEDQPETEQDSQAAICGFLQQLSDLAEQKGSDGIVQGVDADALGAAAGKAKSGRRNAAVKLDLARHAQEQGLRMECIALGMQADVCAVELATLLLLRKTLSGSSSPASAAGAAVSARVQEVVSQLVQSIIITVQSAAIILRNEIVPQNKSSFHKAMGSVVQSGAAATVSAGSAPMKESARAALSAVGRSLLQLQRATHMEMHASGEQWTRLLWEPLGDGVLDLYLVTNPPASPTAVSTGDANASASAVNDEATTVAAMRSVTSLANCIVQVLLPAWAEGAATGQAASSGAGVVGSALARLAAQQLRSASNDATRVVLLNQLLLLLVDPGVGLVDNVVAGSDTAELLSGDWFHLLIAALSGSSASSPAYVSYILSAGFVDVVAFVGGQANGDSARAVLGRCVLADSVECVSIVCKCAAVSSSAFQSAWDPDGLAWVLRTGLNALQGDASVSLSDAQMIVRFMLLVCSQPACGSLATDLFVLAKSRWCVAGLRNKLAEWFMASLVAVALKQNQSQRSAARGVLLPPDLLAAVGAWLGEDPSALPSYLRRLFFARLRDRDAKRAAIHSDYTQLSILNDVTVVVSWADAQKLVLPHLTPQLRLDLYLTISSALNSSLVLADSAGDEDEVADHGDGAGTCLSVLPAESGLHSKKWARHVCALLSAQQSTAALESVKLFTISFWSDCLRGILNGSSAADAFSNQKRLTFALECLHAILSLPMGEDGQIGSALAHFYLTSQPMLVFWILLGVTHSSKVLPASSYPLGSDSTERFLLKLFAGVPNDLRAPFFVEMLDVALDKDKDKDQASAGHLLQDLRAAAAKTLLEREFPTKEFPRELLRLQSPSLRRDERPALGSPGQFLSWKIVAAGDPLVPTSSSSISSGVTPPTDSPQLTRISPIACKLAGVHREAGSDPYFTITMDQTGDVQVAHELQVEWPKVILGRNLPSSHVDLVWNYLPGSSVLARISRTDKFESPVLEACTQWLEKTLMSILQDVNASSNGDSTSTIIRHCTLYSDVLSALCGHLIEASNGIKSTLERRVTAHVRGLAAFLLSPRCTLPACAARSTGMVLLQALLRTDLGTGAGLWLPAVLNHVRVIAASLVSPLSPVDEMQAANFLSFTTATLARILSVISHSSVCLDCAEALLPAALAALPSPATALAPNLLLLLAAVWRHRSDGRDGKAEVPVLGDLSAWETEGFDFSVFVMVEGLAGQPARVRVDACRAVHFCLLKRSRRSCRDLMAPSLVSRFAQQLQRIAVTDPAVGSSPLSVLSADMATVNTLRMTSCKVLDAFEASKGDSSPGRGDNKMPVEPETLYAPNDVSLQEQERLELEQDGRFLSELVGSVYSAELTQRLVVTAASISGEATIDGTTDENDEDGTEGPPTPSSESQTGGGRTPVRKAAKRAALHHLTVRDPLGSVLLWLLLLQSIDARAVEGWTVRARCVNYLKNTGMASNMLFLLIRLSGDMLKFRDVSALLQRVEALHGTQLEEEFSESRPRKHSEQVGQNSTGNIPVGSLQHLAVYALFRTVCTLPAMFRQFWSDDCTRVQKTRLSKFVEERVRESLMKREVALIATSSAAGRWDAGEFAVRGSVVSGEVTAVLSKEETTIEIKVKLPPSYPLKIVEVACTSRIGVSDGRWRRWVLQIIQLLGMQDGSVVDAVLMWKCNIEKELEGVEPCPICYCTLHTKTLSLPSMTCPTCNNKFHSPCLSTWFKSSGKSKCVICQQPFFT